WLSGSWALIGELTLTHLTIAVPAIIASVLIAVPIGAWAQRSKGVGGAVLSFLTVLYAVPSLPLLIVIPVLSGIALRSRVNMVVVLTIYGIAVLIRQCAEAFAAVPVDVLESADALGMSRLRRFCTVELPLAVPVIVSGTRVVITSTVALVTIGAFIGVRSLGTLFTDGFQRGLTVEVLAGLVMTIALALLLDALAVGLGVLMTPWRRK
ncbi:MAG: ABC transporter permease subunit, partial [Dermabacter sp.]|nr:ABC transporter permease subunit [Dermabacter sp.]